MYQYHCPNTAQRAAALQVLADTDGLVYRGLVIDRAGRSGFAFSVVRSVAAAGVYEDLLVIDPASGALLSHEQVIQVTPPSSLVRSPAVMSYVLYLAYGRY